ncbi:MAG: M13 family metallopeptidase, partial [Christensenella sp.]|uniref:M13 family metallopeptidase n=1 Tax=Christensenella sp. TaxID=1935934 RepID=UPI002B1EA42B
EDEAVPFAKGAADQGFGFLLANFSIELSQYYSDNYLTTETKENIDEMCKGIIEEYKDRLRENDWMQDATRQKAIEKLEKMDVIIGEIEAESPVTKGLKLISAEDDGALLQGVFAVQENFIKNNFSTLHQENVGLERIGSTLALFKSYEVNAAYIPNINSIVINAAILNEPYYSPSYSNSRNYGGIGAVIGHEISHAFDQIGSRYDADGNVQNWWLPEDAAEFEARTQKMIQHFDGLPYMGGTIDGKLTVTENTADAGGLSVSLEVLERSDKEADHEEFFRAWTEVWADKATEEEALVRLKTDPHSPGVFRVNQQMMLMDAFYSTYGLQEGDGMFLPKEQRFEIW